MTIKSTYEELEQKVEGLEKEAVKLKLTENALRESEKKYRRLSEASFEAVAITDKGVILDANITFAKMFGYEHHEIVGMEVLNLVAPEALELVSQNIRSGYQETYEHPAIKKDGSIIQVEVRGKAIPYEGRNVRVTAIRDITKQKRIEEELIESYNIINRSPAVVFLWKNDEGWPVEFVSDNVNEIFGYTAEEFISGKITYANTVHLDDLDIVAGEVARYSKEKGRKKFSHVPYRIITKKGEVKWLDDRTYIRRDDKDSITHYQGIVLDITKRHRLEAYLQQAKKMEAIATLSGGIAHQFNNALSAITGTLDLIEIDLPADKGITASINRMKDADHRMTLLTSQLLGYARGGKYYATTISLSDFVRNTLPLIEHTIKPSIHVETDLPSDIFSVEADSSQLQMVLSAVLSNASETIEGKGRIKIICRNERITEENTNDLSGLKPGLYVKLTIEDYGKGMDEETKRHIFEPFFTTKFQGRGLGMAAVYGIVKNHNGWILIDSELGKGTRVNIYLPVISE